MKNREVYIIYLKDKNDKITIYTDFKSIPLGYQCIAVKYDEHWTGRYWVYEKSNSKQK
jgi:hypothetical protein